MKNLQETYDRLRADSSEGGRKVDLKEIYWSLKQADAMGATDWIIKLGTGIYLVYTCGHCTIAPTSSAFLWRCAKLPWLPAHPMT